MLYILIKRNLLFQIILTAINAHTHIAALSCLLQNFLMTAFLSAHNRCQQ